MHTTSHIAALFIAACWIPAPAAPKEEPCRRGWFGVQAIVTRISPASATVQKLSAQGYSSKIAVNFALCDGDTIVFPDGGDGTVVELYKTGEVVHVEASKGPYAIKGGARATIRAATAYVDAAFEALLNLGPPPPRPNPTASRGTGASALAAEEHIQAILNLRNLPRQRVTADAHPIIGWRGGIAPYACQVLNDSSEVVWTLANLGAGWCEFGASLGPAVRLVVRDAGGRSVGWNVATVPWLDVPRPEWVPVETSMLPSADRTAWAIWIWQRAGPEWRLQSLGMLNKAARVEWLANYFVDSVLAEVPPLKPR